MMNNIWRWDQGRLQYFYFDVIKNIASTLVKFDGVDITACEATFRSCLEHETRMPFSPSNYTIKRNYSRVFQCSFLSNFVGNKLVVTDVCRDLAKDEGFQRSVDEYLFNYICKFRFPFPAFENYNAEDIRVYPFCAIIKFLLSKAEAGEEPKASLDDIFNYIISNNCTGLEEVDYFKSLSMKTYVYTESERRQLREILIFISQLSILKFYNGCLYLDTINEDARAEIKSRFLNPELRSPRKNRLEEFYEMTSLSKEIIVPKFETFTSDTFDIQFIEGNTKRVEHLRIERSGLLRKYYRQMNPQPHCCACGVDMHIRYPWTEYLLEIHHLLPLSSTLAISNNGTSLTDIVGLCPSCHRAIHVYYTNWLKSNKQSDFESKQQAHDVFIQATMEIKK